MVSNSLALPILSSAGGFEGQPWGSEGYPRGLRASQGHLRASQGGLRASELFQKSGFSSEDHCAKELDVAGIDIDLGLLVGMPRSPHK